MTVDVNGQHYLAGAVSFGIGCAQVKWPLTFNLVLAALFSIGCAKVT